MDSNHAPIKLQLPATSANLGPGFDALGLALSLHLTVRAHAATDWEIHATGRDAELCGKLDGNLILETYKKAVADAAVDAPPALRLEIHNEIPLGMGCGSSAAAILAGVALADHFAALRLTDDQIVTAASRIEGHPDNVAACWLGGFTVSAMSPRGVETATFPGNPQWQLLLALQPTALATRTARALLPETYSRADAVFNLQRSSLLTAAFAQSRLELLRTAMQDRLHQPYREQACPLLQKLLPLADHPGIAGLALSGAGPSVLVFLAPEATPAHQTQLLAAAGPDVEWLPVRIQAGATRELF